MLTASAACLLLAGGGHADEPPPAPAPAAREAPAENVVVGTSVTVSGDAPVEVLEQAARIGDELVPILAVHFEAEVPKDARPLRVAIHATREGFQRAVKAEGGVEADVATAGGYTPKKTLVSHLWVQAEPFDTRRLVLHELTHQVQDKTFAAFGPGTDVEWHREGLAEYFGWHVRGKGLEVGRVDAVARSRRPAEFVERLSGLDAWKVAVGERPADYTDALGLVYALLTTADGVTREQFRHWERAAWRRRDAAARLPSAFDADPQRIPAAVTEVWGDWQPRWTVVSGAWDERDGDLGGSGTDRAWLKAGRSPHARPAADGEPEGQGRVRIRSVVHARAGSRAGLSLASADGRQRVDLEVEAATVRLVAVDGERRAALKEWALAAPPQGALDLQLEARRSAGALLKVSGSVGGVPGGGTWSVEARDLSGLGIGFQWGAPHLFVEQGSGVFRGLRWDAPDAAPRAPRIR